ncbi:MAG TPA: hypothetical protein VMF30_07270, partial [Pirellulales bacterium]|nr:hypothetical protein [Pirellulales bacterium]
MSLALLVVTVLWTLFMIASLWGRYLDPFLVGTLHGRIGCDFFSTPRAFRNLAIGNSMVLTELDTYGPYATMFLFHPAVAVVNGSWTSMFAPWVAYKLYVGMSLVLLAVGAGMLARQFDSALLRAFTFFALFCSLPTYLLLWTGQAHGLVVLSVALVMAALVAIRRDDRASAGATRLLQIGLLVALCSKPVVLLCLPALFAARETRRALILPLGVYALVSLVLLLVPELNSGGYNGFHWVNLVMGSTSATQIYMLVIPKEFDYSGNPEIYCLSALVQTALGASLPQWVLKIPALIALVASAAPLFLASMGRRIDSLLASIMLCLLMHFLCFSVVWEYHYTTLLPLLPVLAWMAPREERASQRRWLWIAFGVLLMNFVPTLHILDAVTIPSPEISGLLIRVGPVVVAFFCLSLYAAGNFLGAVRERSLASLPGQARELIRDGVVPALCVGALLVGVIVSTPERLMKPLPQWTLNDWRDHYDDILSRPLTALKPGEVALLHSVMGAIYARIDPEQATQHYLIAADLAWDEPGLLCQFADEMKERGFFELAVQAYQRV